MKKKLIKTQYGIQITKPWNQSMYDWNDKIGKLIKIDLYQKLKEFYESTDVDGMNRIASSFGASYGDGYDVDSIYDSIFKDLQNLENYQLNEELDWLVKHNIVKEPEFKFVGYDK